MGYLMLLKSAGFECETYSEAEKFLEKRKPVETDLVILDYHLPGKSCNLLH